MLLILLVALQTAPLPNDDDELFSDLGQELLEESAVEKPVQPPATEPEAVSPEDEKLLEQLGEDLGVAGGSDRYERISQQMRKASDLIERGVASGEATTAQQQVLDDLAALIEQLRQQNPQPQSSPARSPQESVRSKPAQPQPQPGEPTQDNRSGPGQESSQSEAAAQDSSNRLGSRDVDKVDVAGMEALFEDLWGHLPKRDRERMVESPFDRFLPKYEWEIERYFRRLAEDPDLSEQPQERPPSP